MYNSPYGQPHQHHRQHPQRAPNYGPGYHSSAHHSYQPRPPQGVDPQLWQWFQAVDEDHSGSISVHELQTALVNGDWTRFDLDTLKMLMGIFDTDHSGTINFNEFAGLWKYISDWQNVFRHFDRDRSGTIEGRELSEAFKNFGYDLSPFIFQLIAQKYSSQPSAGYGAPAGITFDRFMRASVTVKTLTEAFQRADTDHDGWVQLNYEDFMAIVLSTP